MTDASDEKNKSISSQGDSVAAEGSKRRFAGDPASLPKPLSISISPLKRSRVNQSTVSQSRVSEPNKTSQAPLSEPQKTPSEAEIGNELKEEAPSLQKAEPVRRRRREMRKKTPSSGRLNRSGTKKSRKRALAQKNAQSKIQATGQKRARRAKKPLTRVPASGLVAIITLPLITLKALFKPFLDSLVEAGRSIGRVWRVAERVDSRLWYYVKSVLLALIGGINRLGEWILSAIVGFIRWIPTRAGLGYCSFFLATAIVTTLWIAEEIRTTELNIRSARAADTSRLAPVDLEDPVMARVGGEYIHLSDIIAAAEGAGTLQPGEKLDLDSAFTRELVATYIDQRLLAQAAEGSGLDKTPGLDSRLTAARDRLLAAAYLDTVLKQSVTPEKVQKLYRAQADITNLGEEIRARHILVGSRAEAVAIMNALERGADFSTLARSRSLDRGTAPHGGDTGYITRDMVSEEFGRIAFAIPEGAISPPFRTTDGWNLVSVLEKRDTQPIALNAVEEDLERFLTLRTINATLEQLRSDFDVVIYKHDQDQQDAQNTDQVTINSRG